MTTSPENATPGNGDTPAQTNVSFASIMQQIHALGEIIKDSITPKQAAELETALAGRPHLQREFAIRLQALLERAQHDAPDAEPGTEGAIANITTEMRDNLQESLRGYFEEIMQAAARAPATDPETPPTTKREVKQIGEKGTEGETGKKFNQPKEDVVSIVLQIHALNFLLRIEVEKEKLVQLEGVLWQDADLRKECAQGIHDLLLNAQWAVDKKTKRIEDVTRADLHVRLLAHINDILRKAAQKNAVSASSSAADVQAADVQRKYVQWWRELVTTPRVPSSVLRLLGNLAPNEKRLVGGGASVGVLVLWEVLSRTFTPGILANARLAGRAASAPWLSLFIAIGDIVVRIQQASTNNQQIEKMVGFKEILQELKKLKSSTFDQLVPPERLNAYLELTQLLPARKVDMYADPNHFALACLQKIELANTDGHIVRLAQEEKYAIALAYGRDLYTHASKKAGTLAQGMLLGSAAHSTWLGQPLLPVLTLAAHWMANQAICRFNAQPASQFAINADGELERVTASQAAQTAPSLYDPAHLKDPSKLQELVAKDNLAQPAKKRLITLITEYLNKHPEKSYPDAASMGRDTAISQLMLNMLAEEGGVIPVDANREEEVAKNKEEKKRLEGILEKPESGLKKQKRDFIVQVNFILRLQPAWSLDEASWNSVVSYCRSEDGLQKMRERGLNKLQMDKIATTIQAVEEAEKEIEIQRKNLQKVIQKLQELEGTGAGASEQATKSLPVDEFANSQKYKSYKLGYAAAVLHCFEQLPEHQKERRGVIGTLIELTPLARLPEPAKAVVKRFGLDTVLVTGAVLTGWWWGYVLAAANEGIFTGIPYLWKKYAPGAKKEEPKK